MARWLFKAGVAGLFVAAASVVGCAQPKSGVVGWGSELAPGGFAQDIPFTTADGKRTTFKQVRHSIALVAFTSPPGENCCWVSPELLRLAERFAGHQVTVAQVSEPTGECPHGPGCVEACNLDQGRLVTLCDKDRIAWRAYGQPKPGTVLLVDSSNKIVEVAALGNLGHLAKTAGQMAQAQLRRQQPGKPGTVY